jgi:hypothetical protein
MGGIEYKLTFKQFNETLRKKNKLLGLNCDDCGKYTCPPKMTCQECGGTNLKIAELSGNGKIVTFTSSYVIAAGREVEAPILVILVELDEGPWVMGNLVGIDPNQATMESIIGKKVQLVATRVLPTDMYSKGEESKGGLSRATFAFVA